MKILLFIDNLSTGGAQRQIANLSAGLKSRENEVWILTYSKGNYYQDLIEKDKINFINIQKKSRYSLSPSWNIIKLNKQQHFDIICAFLFTPSFYLLLASPFLSKCKIIVSERTFENLVSKFNKNVTRRFYSLANAIVANSNHQTETLKRIKKRLSSKVFFIPNGVDTEAFKPNSSPKPKNTIFNIICIGRVSQLKNTRTIIEAINLCNKQGLKFRVTWIGAQYEWVEGESGYFNECKKLISEYQLQEKWHWVGQVNNVNDYFKESDILVHASLGEGFPNAICEAMASGVPVVASNILDHPLVISENEDGFLFDPENPVELAEKILSYEQLPQKQKNEMRLNARAKAVKFFSLEKYTDNYLNLFNEVMSH